MSGPRAASIGALVVSLSLGSFGCELIASVDRSEIPSDELPGTGGGGTGPGGGGVAGRGGDGVGGEGGMGVGPGGHGGTAGEPGVGGTGGVGGVGGVGGAGGVAVGGAGGAGGGGGQGGVGGSGCSTPDECPPTGNECIARSCVAGLCGTFFVDNGTPTATQTGGDCQQIVCNGAGATTSVADNADLPVDGNECTGDVCNGGVPSNPFVASGTPCGTGGTLVCNGTGQCVGCVDAGDCSGAVGPCKVDVCNANMCEIGNAANGTACSDANACTQQDSCQAGVCTGANPVTCAAQDQCHDPGTCDPATGTCSNPAKANGTTCNDANTCTQTDACQAGVCTGSNPVTCAAQDQCHDPGSCNPATGMCSNPAKPNGASCADADLCTTSDTCQAGVCTGGAPVTCTPIDQCHDAGTCVPATGVCTTPNKPDGSACTIGAVPGQCALGVCVLPPQLISLTPGDGGGSVALPAAIVAVFDTAMDPSTLWGQTTAGACTGSIQVSSDDFATCIAFDFTFPDMSAGDTVATMAPAPGLLVSTTYRIRVTTAAESSAGVPLAATFTQPTGFGTGIAPSICDGTLVISQVYPGGGNSGAPLDADFVELHNRGATQVSLAGLSLRYTSAAGTTWNVADSKVDLAGTIAAGGYFLVGMTPGANGVALPTPDQTGTLAIATAGKVALLASTATDLPNGACPPAALVVDFVGYGTTATCAEASLAPAASNTTSLSRASSGCADRNDNGADFTAGAPAPRNSASAAQACACGILNESSQAGEVDYCNVQFPTSMTVPTGTLTPVVYGRIFEAGVTEAAAASPIVAAQLGYGPVGTNPQYDGSWTWIDAPFNLQVGNDDEYDATFVAPAAGLYWYAYRFTLDGQTWTLCDLDGAGSNAGLGFSFTQLPALTVTP